MNKDSMLKAAGVAVVGAAGALANAHIIDPSIIAVVTGAVNFILGLFHSRPNHA